MDVRSRQTPKLHPDSIILAEFTYPLVLTKISGSLDAEIRVALTTLRNSLFLDFIGLDFGAFVTRKSRCELVTSIIYDFV